MSEHIKLDTHVNNISLQFSNQIKLVTHVNNTTLQLSNQLINSPSSPLVSSAAGEGVSWGGGSAGRGVGQVQGGSAEGGGSGPRGVSWGGGSGPAGVGQVLGGSARGGLTSVVSKLQMSSSAVSWPYIAFCPMELWVMLQSIMGVKKKKKKLWDGDLPCEQTNKVKL